MTNNQPPYALGTDIYGKNSSTSATESENNEIYENSRSFETGLSYDSDESEYFSPETTNT